MKSIFKKLAFVLALAMIVTLIPAKSAKAADATFSVSKSSIIYVGGSYAGYPAAKYVKSWGYDKDTYTPSYASSNTDVATVSAKGLVTAASVGTAVITVTLQTEDGTIYATNSTKVFVKKNAVSVELGAGTQTHITTGVDAGESFYLAVKRTAADGTTTWKGKTVITDYVKYESSDEKVFTVDKFGKLTGVAAGTATLTMTTMELDGTKDTTKAVATTTPVTYTVKVTAGSIVEAKQTASKVVKLTISSAAAAAKLVATGVSAFKAFYVSGTNDVAAPIKSVAVDADNAAVVDVTLYNCMTAAVTYKFALTDTVDTKVSIVAASNTIASFVGNAASGYVNNGIAPSYSFLNADGVDITAAVIDSEAAYITLALAKEASTYYLTATTSAGKVYFTSAGSADVTVTYDKYATDGTETKFTATSTVTALATAATYGTATYTLVKADTKTTTDNAYPYTYETLCQSVVAGDVNWLYAKVADTVDGSASTTYPDTFDSLHTAVTYTSSDSSVLAVGNVGNNCKVVGVAAGTASIIVTYTINDVSTVVAVLPVTVYASRIPTKFTATCANAKTSADSTGIGECAITLKVLDQLGQELNMSTLGTTTATYLTNANCTGYSCTGSGTAYKIGATGVTSTATATVTYKFTYTYNGTTLTAVAAPSFRIPQSTIASYSLNTSGKNSGWWQYDTDIANLTEVYAWKNFGNTGATMDAATFGPKFSVDELDAYGFTISNVSLASLATTGSSVSVKVSGTEVANATDDIWNLYTFANVATTGTYITAKQAAGTYTAVLYIGGNYKTSTSIYVIDSSSAITYTQNYSTSTLTTESTVIPYCFSVYVDGTQYTYGDGTNGTYGVDVTKVGSTLLVKDFYIIQTTPDGYLYKLTKSVGVTVAATIS